MEDLPINRVTFDGNGKDSVESIPLFLRALDDGIDYAQASRFTPGGKGVATPWLRKWAVNKEEQGDGRPILFRPSAELRGFYSVLGSKLDNIYDLFKIVNSLEVMHES